MGLFNKLLIELVSIGGIFIYVFILVALALLIRVLWLAIPILKNLHLKKVINRSILFFQIKQKLINTFQMLNNKNSASPLGNTELYLYPH